MKVKPATVKLALAWLLSLVTFVAASHLISAQGTAEPRVLSGADLGFRIDGVRQGVPSGHFVVRINGQWVEVKESITASRLTQ